MTWLAAAALRSSVPLLAALLACLWLRRRSAALRHRVLAGALCAAAATLPLALVVPGWAVPLPAAAAPAKNASPDASLRGPAPGGAGAAAADDGPTAARLAATPPVSLAQLALAVWGAGAAAGLGSLLAGWRRLSRVTSRARPLGEGTWARLGREISARYRLRRRVLLLEAEGPVMLATWGLMRPRVLVPASARSWSEERVRIVLGHELAHVARCDWAVQIAAAVFRGLFWFNPLCWFLCARLRRESERACDDEVLAGGVPPADYAGHLVDIARRSRTGVRLNPGLPIARPSTLEGRIAAMLNTRIDRRLPTRRSTAIALALLLGAAAAAAAVRTAAPPAAAPLTGAVYDPTGAVLPQVQLKLQDENAAVREAETDAAGRFDFGVVAPGRYELTASLAGFHTLRQEIALENASDWERAITLQVGTVRETVVLRAPRATPGADARALEEGRSRVRVGGNIRPPRKLLHVNPTYPESMREAGLEGVVPIEALIGIDGTVGSARVLSAQVHPDLAAAALAAVRQWRFSPTLLNGAAVEVVMTVSVEFALSD